jgi:hypothetical protein
LKKRKEKKNQREEPKCQEWTMLCMNVFLMECMRTEYNLHSLIETSETRISKELRDDAEKQAQGAKEMENR